MAKKIEDHADQKQLAEEVCNYLMERSVRAMQHAQVPPDPLTKESLRTYIKPGIIKYVNSLSPSMWVMERIRWDSQFLIIKQNVQHFVETMIVCANDANAAVMHNDLFLHAKNFLEITKESDSNPGNVA